MFWGNLAKFNFYNYQLFYLISLSNRPVKKY